MSRRQKYIIILPICIVFLVVLICDLFVLRSSSISHNINSLESALIYLKDVAQVKWYEIEDNTVYLGFAVLSNDCYIVTDAVALDAHYATKKECQAWAVNAAHKGWRPDTTSLGRGPLYGRAVANKGRLLQSSKAAQDMADRDILVSWMLSKGLIHSVNIELNQVRIDPFIWAELSIERKRQIVLIFGAYFADHGNIGGATILSNRNDNQLATDSVWSGIKILE